MDQAFFVKLLPYQELRENREGQLITKYSFRDGFVQPFFDTFFTLEAEFLAINVRPPVLDSNFPAKFDEKPGYVLTVPSDFSLRLPLPAAAEISSRPSTSRLEDEVVNLFDEMRDRLLRYLLCLGVQVHDGEEIVQESFLLLFKHLQQGKSRANLRGWLFRVVRNLSLKAYRESQACPRRLQFDETLPGLPLCSGADPEQEVCARQRQERLWAVVRALPEQDQICLFLRAEGLRYREIGKELGMSLGSVAASLARSLGKLTRADGGHSG